MGARLRARRFRNKCLKLAIAKSCSLMKPCSVPTLLFFYLNPDSRKHLGTLVLQKWPSPLLHNMNCQPKSIRGSWYFTEQWAFFQFAFLLQTLATLFSSFFPLKLGFCITFALCVLCFLRIRLHFHLRISSFSRFLSSLAFPDKCQIWGLSEKWIEVPSLKGTIRKENNPHWFLMDTSDHRSTSQAPARWGTRELEYILRSTRWGTSALFLSQCTPGGTGSSLLPTVQTGSSFPECSSPQLKSGLPLPRVYF